MNYEKLKATFLKGGYYRYDVPNFDVSVLSINTMYFYQKEVCDEEIMNEMLNWLEFELKENKEKADAKEQYDEPQKKFILAMHAFPGM